MAEVKRQRDKIHSTICEHCIPERGTPGDIWLAKAEQTFWFVTVDGIVVCLTDVLNSHVAHTPPRAGRDGVDGISVKGEPGRDGKDGRAGKDGKDSTVPGPAGTSITGPAGRDGTDGKDAPQRVEFDSFLSAVQKLTKDLKQEFAQLRADQDLLSHAFTDVSKHNQEYLAWLQVKVAERIKAHQQ